MTERKDGVFARGENTYALRQASVKLKYWLDQANVKLASPKLYDAIAKAVVRGYVEGVPRKRVYKLSAETKAMIDLKVGKSITFASKSHAALRSALLVVRKHTANPKFSISIKQCGEKTKVTRIADGTKAERPKDKENAKARQLANLAVGETKLMPWEIFPLDRSIDVHAKHAARTMLGNLNAKWQATKKQTGWVVTREV